MSSDRSSPVFHRAASVLQAVVCVVSLVLVLKTVPDVDLWGHVVFGRDMLASGTIPTVDPYSFTSDRPWIDHEWLAEVAMTWMYGAFGPAGLTLLRWSILASMLGIVWRHLRIEGTPVDRSIFLLALVGLLTYPRTQHLRPQLMSLLAFAWLLTSLKQAERGRRALLYTAPLLMLVWANAHGGWIVGLGALVLWSVVQSGSGESRRLGLLGVAVAVLSACATLLNPYGFHMWRFLWTTVGFTRADIVEWHSVFGAGFGVLAMWSATAVLAARALWRHRVPDLADKFLIVGLGLASLRVSRLDAFFALAAVMLCRDGLLSLGSLQPADAWDFRQLFHVRRPVAAAFAVVPLGLGVLALAPDRIACISLRDADWLPEPEAVEFARSSGLHGNLLTYFDWGEYAIWHLSPSMKVSIDGRRETIYSNDQIAGHLAVYANRPEGIDYLQRIAPDHAWLPRSAPIVQTLIGHGWTPRFEGPRSVMLSRTSDGPSVRLSEVSEPVQRCFPGP